MAPQSVLPLVLLVPQLVKGTISRAPGVSFICYVARRGVRMALTAWHRHSIVLLQVSSSSNQTSRHKNLIFNLQNSTPFHYPFCRSDRPRGIAQQNTLHHQTGPVSKFNRSTPSLRLRRYRRTDSSASKSLQHHRPGFQIRINFQSHTSPALNFHILQDSRDTRISRARTSISTHRQRPSSLIPSTANRIKKG